MDVIQKTMIVADGKDYTIVYSVPKKPSIFDIGNITPKVYVISHSETEVTTDFVNEVLDYFTKNYIENYSNYKCKNVIQRHDDKMVKLQLPYSDYTECILEYERLAVFTYRALGKVMKEIKRANNPNIEVVQKESEILINLTLNYMPFELCRSVADRGLNYLVNDVGIDVEFTHDVKIL